MTHPWRRYLLAASLAACSSDHGVGPPTDGGHDGAGAGDGGVTAHAFTPTFTFESGPVRPLAMSADGTRLYVANTANASLDIMAIGDTGLTLVASTYVGIDPVAVAVRGTGEVWVVNQVSDSVSIVDPTTTPPHVVRTLLVGDEPSDIVFGGPDHDRAFITTAHRGQQRSDASLAGIPGAGDPQLTTAGVPRADVWVFDGADLGTSVGGTPRSIVSLFGDSPRALTVTADGATVYAAIFKSGNQTTATASTLPCPGFDAQGSSSPCTVGGVPIPGAAPGPATNYSGVAAPAVPVMLKADAANVFRDLLGRDWSAAVPFALPDQDVFAIDASTLTTTRTYQHVGTTLFALAVNPVSGAVYVSNTEARNELRFEGPGTFAGSTLQGHLAESRITVLRGSSVTPRYLNKHIDYAQLPAPAGTAAHSLATPVNMAVSADGATLYVSAFGSSKVGVLATSALEQDTFDPTTASSRYVTVTGGGPSGIVIDAARGRLYVATRFDDGVSVIDTAAGSETSHLLLANPEPAVVKAGRRFLYDATVSSSNGEAACASCHMFGDDDHLAWDLGNPDADPVQTPITVKLAIGAPPSINGTGSVSSLHPMKGAMTTQTFRGMVNQGPLHWRGDRVSGFFGTDTRTAPPYDSELAFKNFIVAFNGLLGLGPQLSTTDMQAFTDFALAIQMPPNPVRALDNSLTPSQAAGRTYFLGCDGLDSQSGGAVACGSDGYPTNPAAGHFSDGTTHANLGFTCQGCHTLDPANGFFGTNGQSSFEALPQTVKIPQLRNLWDKVGMFGEVANRTTDAGDNGKTGAQVRGTGFANDGSEDTLFRFLKGSVFGASPGGRVGFASGSAGDTQRRAVEQYLLAFDTDLAPIVGQQATLRADNAAAVGPRIDMLVARASAPFVSRILGTGVHECDLVARAGSVTYQLSVADHLFHPSSGAAALTDAQLRARAGAGAEITYTCLPPGWVQ